MNVFRINTNGILEISYPEITIYKEFSDLVNKYPNNYDVYFKYIYFISDYKSKCNQDGMTDKEANKYATSVLNINNEQLEDPIIKKAINRYKELNGSIIRDNLMTLKKALSKTNKIISMLDDKLDKMMTVIANSDDEVKGETYEPVLKLVNQIFSLSVDVPKHIKNIDELEKLIFSDSESKIKEFARGKKNIEESFDPDNDVERDL